MNICMETHLMSIQITIPWHMFWPLPNWMQWGHRQIVGLANYNFHIHYKSGKSNVEADDLSRIEWEKCDETIQAESIQAIVAAAIAGDVANHIESVPCSVQNNWISFPSISDIPAISKAITRSSRQSHLTCLEPKSLYQKQ